MFNLIKTKMKKFKQINVVLMLLSLFIVVSCDKKEKKDQPNPVENDRPYFVSKTNEIGDGSDNFRVKKGAYTLKKGVYVLKGWVYVAEGAKLTIEAGTVIKGDKDTKASLIIEPGAQIFAQGSKTAPIVFTSNQAVGKRKPGDWGGLVICGNAPNNQTKAIIEGGLTTQHGGNNPNDNSGVLSYVRIEFAGYPFKEDQEINGLTLGSVGAGTQIDHIQVSYSNDDSYEWFGGNVNCKYLVAYRGWDDDFDTDFGYSGKLQYLLSVRHPRIADKSWSNSFESDNDGKGSSKQPWTSAVFSNVTVVGPMGQDAAFQNNGDYINAGEYNPNNGSKLGAYLSSIQIRRNSHINIFNSVFMGFPVGLIVENDKGSTTQTWAKDGVIDFENIYFAGMGIVGTDVNKKTSPMYSTDGGKTFDVEKTPFSETFFSSKPSNKSLNSISDLKLEQPNSLKSNPSWLPTSSSPLLGKANFSNSKLASFFDKVSYVGAFNKGDNWLEGWTNFDPQNTKY